ncbi:MAG: TrkH family potassium uptake protein [Clostridiales bacterium]|nr:TrkH family potassium uptake protein [Clostridiales bacterium]
MNYRLIFNTMGKVLIVTAVLLIIPMLVGLIYSELIVAWAFLTTALVSLVVGLILVLTCKPKTNVMFAKEGLIIVAFAWIAVSLIGAIPFTLSGEIPSYVDAVFEMVSGFTTTGASILKDVEIISHGVLFWRSFSHWIGGMGVLVFVMAITPKATDRSIHIMRAEMPGHSVDKLVPKANETAKILYIIYIVMTAVMVILLLCGGMTVFESLVHAFGTAGTGGFGIKSDSLGGYSAYVQWVVAIGMLMFGINFNMYYLLLLRKFKSIFKSTELKTYILIFIGAVVIVCFNIYPKCANFEEALRTSIFQCSSIMTTTGFSTTDFNLWNSAAKAVLIILVFIGGCAGSTAGGLKVSRVVILLKKLGNEIKRVLHPRSANIVKFEGKKLDESTISGVQSYFTIYIVMFVALFLLISMDTTYGFETDFTAVAVCFNNVGPGFGAVGPMSNFAGYSIFGKIVLSFAMLLGRLEIYPLLLALSPNTWIKK